MKTIIYFLLAIFILGILAQGFRYKSNSTQKILIQSTDNRISSERLDQSANVISGRLKSFKNEEFKITMIPGKNQILLTLNNKWDLKTTANLITQKGSMEFYEAYNNREIQELFKGDERLYTFFHGKTPNSESAELGCTTASEIAKVNEFLHELKLQEKCKFAWTNFFEHSEVCLYALKQQNGHGCLLKGYDIEYFKCKHDSAGNKYFIEFRFKQNAIASWADITRRNLNKSIAIVLDDMVLYAPVVRSEITGGNCQVSGDFTMEQLQFLAAIMEHGELPAEFKVVK